MLLEITGEEDGKEPPSPPPGAGAAAALSLAILRTGLKFLSSLPTSERTESDIALSASSEASSLESSA